MSWFEEQIKQRAESDEVLFSSAFEGIADAVLGVKVHSALNSNTEKSKYAIVAILNYFNIKSIDIPEFIGDINEQLEYAMHPNGIMHRNVKLSKGWYKDATGPMLGCIKSDGSAIALLPSGLSGYRYFDDTQKKYIKINSKNENFFEDEAIAFYKPFPLKELSIGDLIIYILKSLSVSDYLFVALSSLAVTLLGVLTTRLNSILMGTVLESKEISLLLGLMSFMLSASIASILIEAVRTAMISRVNIKLDFHVHAATMARIFSLPATFFNDYSAGELSSLIEKVRSLCGMVISAALGGVLTSLFSLLYITQIFTFAPSLVIPALSISIVTVIFSIITAIVQVRVSRRLMTLETKQSGLSYALISGVQKIKLAGAEKRAFAKWSNLYAKTAALTYNPPLLLKYSEAISVVISGIGTIVIYYFAITSKVSVEHYYAFNVSYGMFSAAFMALVSVAASLANIRPLLEAIKPLLKTLPEISENKTVVTSISGNIDIDNVSFRYTQNTPNVLQDLSLKIKAGQYVAIVGETGCGKSTLIRLLLGLETAQKGAIFYDNKDISIIDLKSLRRNIGTVMQHSSLFSGDIFSNITVSAPWLTQNEAWEAAEIAAIADDIREMPMGMFTYITEGSGGISGGQKQRLIIARAIAPKPKVLIFDEATSALDNITQKKISEALDSLKCTRIVVAHRLSTIRHCDRIVYLENGHIVEDGSYDKLMALKGKFAELVERQQTNNK